MIVESQWEDILPMAVEMAVRKLVPRTPAAIEAPFTGVVKMADVVCMAKGRQRSKDEVELDLTIVWLTANTAF